MLGCLHAGLVGQLLGCRPCDALLFPSLLRLPSFLLRHAGLVGTAVSLTAIVSLAAAAATRFSGTAFGLRPALAKSRRSGHAGLLFPSLLLRRPVSLGLLSGFARRLQSRMPFFRQSRMPSWDQNRRLIPGGHSGGIEQGNSELKMAGLI